MAFTDEDLRGGPSAATAAADAGEALARAALALARRLSTGATMWCVAPEWPEHSRHVAVEFVHPVIVGKPALSAVSVDAADPVDALRTLVSPGDIVVTIGTTTDNEVRRVVQRCEAWGALSIWIGAGPRPDRCLADHLLWVDDSPHEVAHDGRLVFQYHVLWELAHVCLEHPGLLGATDACGEDENLCITCSDEGRLGEVVAIDAGTTMVRTAAGIEPTDTTLVGTRHQGDLVLIHAGVAIAIVDDAGGGRGRT